MKIIFFAHPDFLAHQSMPRYAKMLAEGMTGKGHDVEVWTAKSFFYKLSPNRKLKKWMGYIDQYLLFPFTIKSRIKSVPQNTLFVFTDHALGPWVPFVSERHHVIHCHDFLAQRSALGEINENKTGWSGKKYQQYIRKGFQKGKHFISISKQTQDELSRFLMVPPVSSHIVYNGLNQKFERVEKAHARKEFIKSARLDINGRYILHVGGNHFYKNRKGVIEIYDQWRKTSRTPADLVLIGEAPNQELTMAVESSPFRSSIHLLIGVDDRLLRIAYPGADVLLFPSIAEGFGWPIAEAMASGTPVITTAEAPMTEVAGDAAILIPRRPSQQAMADSWAKAGSKALEEILSMPGAEYEQLVEKGLINAKRFEPQAMMNQVESIYNQILNANQPVAN
ncbi:glycosyltransferase family 4 protein [Flavitalea sp.]|nr:glycosyltransferase family 1 protein [Flavitalea sp.]